jgi:paraquat-inducible protein B
MYQGLEVGQLSKLNLNPGGKVTGEMTVDPSVVTCCGENADSDEEAEDLPR